MPELDELLPRELKQAVELRMQRESPAVYAEWAAGFTSLVAALGATVDEMQHRREVLETNQHTECLSVDRELADTDWRAKAVLFGVHDAEPAAKARIDAIHEAVRQHSRTIKQRAAQWQRL